MERLRYYTPLRSAAQPRQFLAFDCEGVGGRDGFVLGTAYDGTTTATFTDPARMWAYLLSSEHGDRWRVAFNLEYDLAVLNLEALLSGGGLMGPGGLLWLDAEDDQGHPIRFMDAARLWHGESLRRVGQAIGLEKGELDDEQLRMLRNKVPTCDWTGPELQCLMDYCSRDSQILFQAVEALQLLVLHVGGQLRETCGATAHDIWRRAYQEHPVRTLSENVNETCRPAYYGGRAEPYLMGWVNGCDLYDVNSLYPACLREARFPDPGFLDLELQGKLPADLERREGVLCATVTVADRHVPPLPARVGGSLYFPVGTYTGLWQINELRYALEHGVEVQSVHWHVSTKMHCNPFQPFVDALWSEREAMLARGDDREKWIKGLLNAFIGRWGVRLDRSLARLELVRSAEEIARHSGRIWDCLYGYDYVEVPLDEGHTPPYANVLFASQVAAAARVVLHQAMLDQGDDLVYCDTDSVITRRAMPTGTGLGEWKAVLTGCQADVIGPKEYALIRDYEVAAVKAKGVPPDLAVQYVQMGKARWERALSIREAVMRGQPPGSWVEVVKSRRAPFPKRQPLDLWTSPGRPVRTQPHRFADLLTEYQLQLPTHQESSDCHAG